TGSGVVTTSAWRLMVAAYMSGTGASAPVSPTGIMCESCWPAPIAGLEISGFGGTPWATATPSTATVERPASRPAHFLNADMEGSLKVGLVQSPASLPAG